MIEIRIIAEINPEQENALISEILRVSDAIGIDLSVHESKQIESQNELLDALIWFCDRVDKGEIRSVKTYAKFKELIAKSSLT